MGLRSFAPRSLETFAALGAEAQKGPGERSRRLSARSSLAYLRPEQANMAVYLAEKSAFGATLPKAPTGCQAAGGAVGTQAG